MGRSEWGPAIRRALLITITLLLLAGETAGAAESAGDLDKAQLAVKGSPEDFQARSALGLLLLKLGRPGEAAGHLQKAARLQPKSGWARVNLARAYELDGRAGAALSELRKAVDVDPSSPWIRRQYADFLARSGRRAEAIAVYEALVSSTSEVDERLRLADLYRDAGDCRAALRGYRGAVEAKPQEPRFHAYLGAAYRICGDRVRAREELGKALKPEEADPGLIGLVAREAAAAGDERRGGDLMARFATSSAPAAALQRGYWYRQEGDDGRAEREFSGALQAGGGAEASKGLGYLRWDQRRWGGAEDSFVEALRIDPQDDGARQSLENLRGGAYPVFSPALALSGGVFSQQYPGDTAAYELDDHRLALATQDDRRGILRMARSEGYRVGGAWTGSATRTSAFYSQYDADGYFDLNQRNFIRFLSKTGGFGLERALPWTPLFGRAVVSPRYQRSVNTATNSEEVRDEGSMGLALGPWFQDRFRLNTRLGIGQGRQQRFDFRSDTLSGSAELIQFLRSADMSLSYGVTGSKTRFSPGASQFNTSDFRLAAFKGFWSDYWVAPAAWERQFVDRSDAAFKASSLNESVEVGRRFFGPSEAAFSAGYSAGLQRHDFDAFQLGVRIRLVGLWPYRYALDNDRWTALRASTSLYLSYNRNFLTRLGRAQDVVSAGLQVF